MRRLPLISLAALIAISLFLPGCAGQTATKIRVATDATSPPFQYVNEKTKQIEGFDIDLMNEVVRKAGLQVEYINVGFESLLAKINAGLKSCLDEKLVDKLIDKSLFRQN